MAYVESAQYDVVALLVLGVCMWARSAHTPQPQRAVAGSHKQPQALHFFSRFFSAEFACGSEKEDAAVQ